MAHAVWLLCRFNLSLLEVEKMFLQSGIAVSYATIRPWDVKFGPGRTRGLRRRQARSGEIWHLGKVVVKISGRKL